MINPQEIFFEIIWSLKREQIEKEYRDGLIDETALFNKINLAHADTYQILSNVMESYSNNGNESNDDD